MRLCVSDSHEGLKAAIARVLDCSWQRCCVHFVRDMHQNCRPAQRALVSAALREVFNADGHERARERVGHVIEQLAPIAPKVAIEHNDKWLVSRRFLSQESLAAPAIREAELSGTAVQERSKTNWKGTRQRRSPPSPPEGTCHRRSRATPPNTT